MKSTPPLRLCVILLFSMIMSLAYILHKSFESKNEREKEEQRILLIQIEYNQIYEAREQLADYYNNLTYIRHDIEKCLVGKGYLELSTDRSVLEKDYKECVKIAHIVNKVGDIEQIQKLAIKPFPKEINQYKPFEDGET